MTLTDKAIPYYYWFKNGFGEISLPLGLFNFATIVIIALTQKGIGIPLLAIPVIALVIISGCIFIGWFFQHYEINGRIATLIIQKQNPEIDQLCKGVKELVERDRKRNGVSGNGVSGIPTEIDHTPVSLEMCPYCKEMKPVNGFSECKEPRSKHHGKKLCHRCVDRVLDAFDGGGYI